MNKEIKGVCVIDSVYTFLIFMLVNIKQYNSFFYIFWRNIPSCVFNSVKYKMRNEDRFDSISHPLYVFNNFFYRLRFYYLMTIHHLWGYTISGQDHLPFGRYVLNFSNARFEEYEDGMASYIMDRPEISYRRIRRLLSANSEPTFGWSKKVEKIYLTTPSIPLSKTISEKVEYVNIIKRWEALSSKEKKIIQSIFDMEESVISIKTDTILLTRPFSEERMCSEEEKTKQVNEIVKNYDCKKIAIKPHYRELTDYTKLFPDIPVINSSYPIELLLLVCGSNIKRIVTFGNCSAELFIKHYMPQIEYVCV